MGGNWAKRLAEEEKPVNSTLEEICQIFFVY
jgi:hypothetical protein